MPRSPAWADSCTIDDVWNSLQATADAISSSACTSACADGAGCAVAATISVALGAASADTGQGAINQFCNQLQNIANTAQNDANSVIGVANQIPGLSAVAGALSDAASSLLDVGNVALCGCALEQGLSQLSNDIGDCVKDALCWGQQLIGDPCNCQAPPPIFGSCAQSNVADCGSWDNPDPACVGTNGTNPILAGKDGQNVPGFTPVHVVTTASGTLVTQGGDSNDGHGHCSPVVMCYCPAPMVPTWTLDFPNKGSTGYDFYIFSCGCPDGTHAGPTVAGKSICICNETNRPADFSPNSLFGVCPVICTNGQIQIGQKCVTPCADPTQGMTEDGTCCDPNQVTACGMCCPPGTTPTAAGTCAPPEIIR